MKAALQRVAAAHGESASFLPVIVVRFNGPLQVQPDTIVPQTDGSIVLKAAQADHFMNYNGRGYEAPSTLYKLRWNVAAKPGSYRVGFVIDPRLQNAGAVVMVNGKSTVAKFAAPGDIASSQELTLTETVTIGDKAYTTVEITPPSLSSKAHRFRPTSSS